MMARSIRRLAGALCLGGVLLALCAVARAEDDALEDIGRYSVRTSGKQVRGPWRAWVEVRSDRMSRALRQWTTLFRQGPTDEKPVALVFGARGGGTAFHLHEDGWLVAKDAPADPAQVFAPGTTTGVPRPELHVAPPSRFVAEGYLSVGPGRFGESPLRFEIGWVPFRKDAKGTRELGPLVPVLALEAEAAAKGYRLADVAVRREHDRPVVSWAVPVERLLHTGEVWIDGKTAEVEKTVARTVEGTAAVEEMARRLLAKRIDDEYFDRLHAERPEILGDVLALWWAKRSTTARAAEPCMEGICRTTLAGVQGGDRFEVVGPRDAYVDSLRWTIGTRDGHEVLVSLQAGYAPGVADAPPVAIGHESGRPEEASAPPGFALGALFVGSKNAVEGLRPVWFARRADGTLDRASVRLGPVVGRFGDAEPMILGDGRAVVGFHGLASDQVFALGLLVRDVPGPRTVKVAAIQAPSVLGDVEGNRKRFSALVEDAAKSGAKIVVLPETAITGYLSQDLRTVWHVPGRPRSDAFPEGKDPAAFAETVPGPSTEHFGALAKEHGIYVTVPLVEVDDRLRNERRFFNTVVLLSPKGEIVAHYRKLTPWPHPEQSWATAGDRGLATHETEWGRVGLAICYDVHDVWPRYAKKDLWALLYPIAWVSSGDDAEWFGKLLPARAKEMGFHVIGANWSVDSPQQWSGYGHSVVIHRNGSVLAKAVSSLWSEILYADLPVDR
jgi:predicted amidohydrolase